MQQVLKQKLRERFPSQIVDYNASYVGVDNSEGREKVQLYNIIVYYVKHGNGSFHSIFTHLFEKC